jgi:hypothetical protein
VSKGCPLTTAQIPPQPPEIKLLAPLFFGPTFSDPMFDDQYFTILIRGKNVATLISDNDICSDAAVFQGLLTFWTLPA